MAYTGEGDPIGDILEQLPVVLSIRSGPITEPISRFIESRLLQSNPRLVAIIRETIDDLSKQIGSNPDLKKTQKNTYELSPDQLNGIIAQSALTTLSEVVLALGLAHIREQAEDSLTTL
jgi:hypothetical protein